MDQLELVSFVDDEENDEVCPSKDAIGRRASQQDKNNVNWIAELSPYRLVKWNEVVAKEGLNAVHPLPVVDLLLVHFLVFVDEEGDFPHDLLFHVRPHTIDQAV